MAYVIGASPTSDASLKKKEKNNAMTLPHQSKKQHEGTVAAESDHETSSGRLLFHTKHAASVFMQATFHYFHIKAYNMMWQSQPIQPSRPSTPTHMACNKAGMLWNGNNDIKSVTLPFRSHIADSNCYEGSCRHITRRQELCLSLLHT